uniref:AlkB homolog 2, alpha-ketoglutarate-dependent dioxygenase n=1 Tax=Sinocyclocheilus grahami TaxID=75366 RepID=A0A672REN0_SINGR
TRGAKSERLVFSHACRERRTKTKLLGCPFSSFLAKLQVYGKSYSVPRKQATYGDEGLMYSFSGVHLLATGHTFNFVLINRYNDGRDHIGEHRDDERELDPACPIASVSLGLPVTSFSDIRMRELVLLAHGSLLLMNYPTTTYWYHSLPVRRKVKMPRINLTFRRIKKKRIHFAKSFKD